METPPTTLRDSDESEAQIKRTISSASNIHRRMLCPGSANAERGLDNEDSEWSEEGTMLHHLDANPSESRAELTERQRQMLEVNAELRGEFVSIQCEKLGIDMATCKVIREREFVLCDENGDPIEKPEPFVGHPDIIYYFKSHKVAFIFDSKFGYKPVEKSETNMQLRCYAVMFAEEFECQTIFVAITQPRLHHEENFHAAEYRGDEIPKFKTQILEILKATEVTDAPRHASRGACNYCLAAGTCKAAASVVEQVANANPDDMTPKEIDAFYDKVVLAGKISEKIKAKLKYLAENKPEELTFWELAQPRIGRSAKDCLKAFEVIYATGELLDLNRDIAFVQYLRACDPSLDMLMRVIWNAKDKTVKQSAIVERLRGILRGADLLEETPISASLREKQI